MTKTEADTIPLRLGSQGPRVKRVQVWLLRNFGLGGQMTGVFDEPTQKRIARALQLDEIDQETFEELGMGLPVHQQPAYR